MAQELTWKVTVDPAQASAALREVRAEVAATTQASQNANKSELSMRQQLSAVASLQRQRSAAMVAEWKRTERAASDLAKGVRPVGENLQRVTDIMQALGASSATLTGPLGGVAGRLRSVGSLATEAGGGLGIAGAAIAALVVAAVGAIVVIAKLNQEAFQAADAWSKYGEEIYKAKLITGQSAEQLSVLKIIASETDTSFEGLTRTAAKLQVSISKGITEPSSEAGRALKFLQLNTEDFKKATPDQQLQRTAKALNEVTNQSDKNRASTALLSRGYTESAAALHEIGNRYNETRERAEALGLVMSEESVEAAHKFDDAMDEVKTGLIAFTFQVGQRTAPVILAVLNDISRSLGLNQNSWREWGALVGDILAAVVTGTARAARDISTAIKNLPLAMLGGPLGTVEWLRRIAVTDAEEAKKQLDILRASRAETGGSLSAGTGIIPRPGGSTFEGRGKKGGKKTRDTEMQDSIKDAALAERELRQKIEGDIADNKRALDTQARDITEFTRLAIELAEQKHDATIVKINAEQEALDRALAQKLIKQRAYDQKDRELALENNEAAQKFADEKWELEQKRDKDIASAELAAHERSVKMADEASERIIASIRDRIERAEILESEGEQQIAQEVADGYERRKVLLNDELSRITTSAERKREINDELIRLEGERAGAAVDASRKIRDALEAEAEQRRRMAAEIAEIDAEIRVADLDRRRREVELLAFRVGLNARTIALFRQLTLDEETEHHKRVLGEIDAQRRSAHAIDVGGKNKLEIERKYNELREQENQRHQGRQTEINAPGGADVSGAAPLDAFAQFDQMIKEKLSGTELTAATAGLQAMSLAFSQLGEAVGQAAYAFVLYGDSGTNLKKMAAQVIASIAQMATVKAIWELAEGFAMLALNFFWPDPKLTASAVAHFKAAAIYGGMAAIAIGAGRMVAGDAFQQASGTGGGGAGSSSQQTPRDRTIREGRQGGAGDPNAEKVIGRLAIDLKHPDGTLETQMVRIVERNGQFRAKLRSDLLGEANG